MPTGKGKVGRTDVPHPNEVDENNFSTRPTWNRVGATRQETEMNTIRATHGVSHDDTNSPAVKKTIIYTP